MTDKSDIAKILRKLRIEHELTQEDVAKVLGMQRTTYSKYEKDHKPEITVLIRLSEFYSISLDEMLKPIRKKTISDSVMVHAPHPDDEKLELWEPSGFSKDEKRLIQLFRYCKRKKLIIEAAQKIVTEDMLIDEIVEDFNKKPTDK